MKQITPRWGFLDSKDLRQAYEAVREIHISRLYVSENHYILFGWRTVEAMHRVLCPLLLTAPFRFS